MLDIWRAIIINLTKFAGGRFTVKSIETMAGNSCEKHQVKRHSDTPRDSDDRGKHSRATSAWRDDSGRYGRHARYPLD
jgi:hypothetical protein